MDCLKDKLDNTNSVQLSTGNISTSTLEHSGHSTFIEKMIINNNKKKIKEVLNSNIYIENNRENTVSRVSKPETQNIPDPRFKSPAFRDAVRVVLQYFGYETPTFADFKNVDAKFNGRLSWLEMAKRKLQPRFDAIVFVLDGLGRRVFNSRGFVKKCVTLFGDTRDEALKKMDGCFEFERWFE